MHWKFILNLIISVTIVLNVQSQTVNGTLSGEVQTTTSKPIEAVTVSLLKKGDTSAIKKTFTDAAGKYLFTNVDHGKYVLEISAVGYKKESSKEISISIDNAKQIVPVIRLSTETKSLQAVSVVSKKPFIENKIDKTVVNVEASPTSSGLTALEMLEKSPGVTVDNDGNISVKGKSGVIILVDGKSTFLSGQDLTNYLKNLSANQLDQIEIMTQPSAKYDASGNSGIINFKTKKSKSGGFNGSINTSAIFANYFKNTNSLNFNYKQNKVNVFGSLGYSKWLGFNDLTITRAFRTSAKYNSNRYYDQNTFGKFVSEPLSGKIGIDFSVSKKVQIGVVINGNEAQQSFTSSGINYISDSSYHIVENNKSFTKNNDPEKNLGANLNFKYTSSKGDELTADGDYIIYRNRSSEFSNNYLYNANNNLVEEPYLLNGVLPSDIDIYSFKSDYSRSLKNGLKIEAGIKSSYVKTDNNAQYTKYDSTQHEWLKDAGRSNHFIYQENINAAYLNLQRQYKKWGLQVGLRAEQTISKGVQDVDHSSFTKNYIKLFPTTYLSYKMNDSNTFALSYGRRIQRPSYDDLNPFQSLLDRYTYQQGNPLLQPQFSHNIELSYNYHGQLNIALNYTTTSGIMNTVIKTAKSGNNYITYAIKENIASRVNRGIAISYNKPMNKWWTINLSLNGFNNHFKGIVDNEPIDVSITSFNGNISNQFTLGKDWTGELSGFYNHKNLVSSVILAEPMGMFAFGVGKQVLNKKGSIKVNVRDPFWVMKFSGYTAMDTYTTNLLSRWDNRRLIIAFTYRFGKNNNAPQKQSRKSAEEEESRVGKGNEN